MHQQNLIVGLFLTQEPKRDPTLLLCHLILPPPPPPPPPSSFASSISSNVRHGGLLVDCACSQLTNTSLTGTCAVQLSMLLRSGTLLLLFFLAEAL